MVEGLLLLLWVAGGLFGLVLFESVLIDGRVGDDGGWCMLGLLWMFGGLVELGITVLVVMMSFGGGPWGVRGCGRLLEGGWFGVVDGWEVHFHGGL